MRRIGFIILLLMQIESAYADCASSLGITFTPNQTIALCSVFGSAITQSLIPSVNDTYDLGSSSKRWSTVYANDAFNGPTAGILLTLGSTSTYSFEPEEWNFPDSGENGFHIEAPNQTTGIAICGGNGSETDRGGCMDAFGASQATTPGMVDMHGANISGGSASNSTGHIRLRAFQTSEVQLQTSGGTQAINVTSAGQIRYTATPLVFFADTVDGADSKYIAMVGGGTSSSSRGGSVVAEGNEVASTGGSVTLTSGDVSTGKIDLNAANSSGSVRIKKAGTVKWTLDDQFIGTGTTTIGWTVVAFGSTDCTTTCVTPCVAGFDAGVPAMVSCASAAADQCLCAGAS